MSLYKGVPTALGEIPQGTPVQCLRQQDAGWLYPQNQPQVEDVGILLNTKVYDYNYIQAKVLKDGKELLALEAKGASPVFQVMTGTKAAQVSAQWAQASPEQVWIDRGYGTFGTDPEVFVLGGDGVVLPAWKYLPEKAAGQSYTQKSKPRSCVDPLRTVKIFWDGFQAEWTTDAQTCLAFLGDYAQAGLQGILAAARKVDPKAALTHKCVLDVPYEMMQACERVHAQLGCAPSTSVYSDDAPLRIEDGRQLPFRFAGCHAHIGCGKLLPAQVQTIVRALDNFYGVQSVLINQGLEDERRRQFYGRAGEYRLPPHGLEYRVPSSAVLAHPANFLLHFDLIRCAFQVGMDGKGRYWQGSEQETREIVNNLDLDQARKAVKRNETLIRKMYQAIYGSYDPQVTDKRLTKSLAIIDKGIASVVDTTNMEKAWGLDGSWIAHSESPGCQFGKVLAAA